MTFEFWSNIFFIVLNSGLLLFIAYRVVRTSVMPALRGSMALHDQEVHDTTAHIRDAKTELLNAKQHAMMQEREIARLTSTMEKWAGVLSQRAASAEAEARELSFRYKLRCEDNARARVQRTVHQKVTRRVLQNVRKSLSCTYVHPTMQQEFMDRVCTKLRTKDHHDQV